jgi:hypothetical protein
MKKPHHPLGVVGLQKYIIRIVIHDYHVQVYPHLHLLRVGADVVASR